MDQATENEIKQFIAQRCIQPIAERGWTPEVRVQTDWEPERGVATTYRLTCARGELRAQTSVTLTQELLQRAVSEKNMITAEILRMSTEMLRRLARLEQ